MLVKIVEFGTILQSQDEAVAALLSRLKGAALNCNFRVKCPLEDCGKNINYYEEMIAHQLLKGLVDPGLQEEVLLKGSDNLDMSLKAIVKVVSDKDQSKRIQGLLVSGTAAGVGNTETATSWLSKKVETKMRFLSRSVSNADTGNMGLVQKTRRKTANQ